MLIIWDYFGVIAQNPYWDEIDDWADSKGVYQKLRKIQQESDEGKIGWEEYCKDVSKMRGVSPEEVLNNYKVHNINQQVINTVRQSKVHTHVVLSNASHGYLLPIMDSLGLSSIFSEIFVSSSLGLAKPDPRAFLYVLHAMGHSPDSAIMIDDSTQNIDAAHKLGMMGIVYSRGMDISRELEALTT